MNKGLDVGTNMLVASQLDENKQTIFRMQRDAFYKIIPKSDVNRSSIKMSFGKRGINYIEDVGDFIVVGQDALDIAIERNDVAQRPLKKGVVSPKEKDSLPVIKLIIEQLIGKGSGEDKLVYSVPAKPIDGDFDIIYHREMMGHYLQEMGYIAKPLNEAFAVGLSELIDDGLTGITASFGSGMVNISVLHAGDSLIEFSTTQAGDYIDLSVGTALDISPSLVQMEKESGINLMNPKNKIIEAVSIYYTSILNYTFNNVAFELKKREKDLPRFKNAIPIVVSGGLSLADGFVEKVQQIITNLGLPIKISEVRRALHPMTAVANGCLLAAEL